MTSSFATDFLIPAVLIFMMIGMGITLKVGDFIRLYEQKTPVLVGLMCQVMLLPLLGLTITQLLTLPVDFVVGFLIICFCPGGAGSNLITLLAKGDKALSVTLTAISNFLAVLTLPLLLNLAVSSHYEIQDRPALPILSTMLLTALITTVPVLIGMKVRTYIGESRADASEKHFQNISAVLLVILMLGIAIKNRSVIQDSFLTLGPAVILLNLAALFIGFVVASLFRLNLEQRIAISVETGFQNAALAIVITTTFLENFQMALVPTFYGGTMFLGAFLAIAVFRTKIFQVQPEGSGLCSSTKM